MTTSHLNRKWYSGMRTSEDWWSVWLGLIMVGLGLFSLTGIDLVGWVAQPKTWVDPGRGIVVAGKAYQGLHPLVSLLITYAVFTVLTCIGAAAMKWNVKRYFLGFSFLFLLTWAIWFLGSNAHLAAMSNQFEKYGITWGLSMGSGAAYLIALAVGLIIGNFFKPFAEFLKEAAKPEWFIKTAIVYLGIKLGIQSMSAAGYAFELAITGAAATFAAYLLFWPLSYTVSRRIFKLPREWAATLASGVSICGVSASIAPGGAIRSRPIVPVIVSVLVVVFTIFLIVLLPPLYTAILPDQPIVAGSATGMTVKTDGADAATGAILDEMMVARAAENGQIWEKGWILAAAIMTKIWIDMFIGVWAFILAIIWVYKVERNPGQTRVPVSEIWFRFPKFVIGYFIAWFAYLGIALIAPELENAAKIGANPVAGPMRHLMFMLTFVAIGIITDFSKLKGIGRPALSYALAQFIIIPPIALFIAYVFHNNMMVPMVH